MQPPIVNYCLKVKTYGHTEPQLVPKLLLQVSVRELHNNLVRDKYNGVLKEARDAENNIIISNSTLRSVFPPQFLKIVKIQGHVWLLMLHICQSIDT